MKKKREGKHYETNRQCFAARNKVQEKMQCIPTEAWLTYVTQKETSEQKHNEERFQETAKEAIISGIAQLKRTLEEIERIQGRLPGVIVYPETTTRPLSYAVEPLLKKIYVKHGQKMPHRMFVKTFSASVYQLEQDGNNRLTRIQMELRKTQETVEKVKRDIKKHRPRTKEYNSVSERLNQLRRKQQELHDELNETKEHIHKFEQNASHDAVNQRIREIISHAPDAPILAIDDLISQGRTFLALEDAFKDAGRIEDVYYFTFLSLPNPLEGLPIKKERFSVGTVVKGTLGLADIVHEEGEEEQEVSHVFAHDRLVEDDTGRWRDLFRYGFPFRFKKEEVTGVLKDQVNPSRYVEHFGKRHSSLMRSVRQKYHTWGEEALEKLNL